MTRQQAINAYKKNNFQEIPNNSSGISTDVLVNGSIIVRIGEDPGYAHFARLVGSTNSGLKNVVKIFSHNEPLGVVNNLNNNNEYSITEIELLTDMSAQESIDYHKWASTALNEIIMEKKPATDPFNLTDDIQILFKYAKDNDLLLDLVQSKNIMKRASTFIITDPFA